MLDEIVDNPVSSKHCDLDLPIRISTHDPVCTDRLYALVLVGVPTEVSFAEPFENISDA